MSLPWKSAWITGASSGIGRELALQLASQNVEIYASARRSDALQILSGINNNIRSINLDVSKIKDVRKKTKFFFEDDNFPDLVILNAGVSRLFTLDKIDEKHQDIIDSMDTNYFGVINCLSVTNGFACGECQSCNKIINNNHEFLNYIIPLPKGKISSKKDDIAKSFNDKTLAQYNSQFKNKLKDPYYHIKIDGDHSSYLLL